MVYSFPTNEKLWAEYAQIRAESFQNGGDGSAATEFYRKHRGAMDAGAEVAWPERYNEDELSAFRRMTSAEPENRASSTSLMKGFAGAGLAGDVAPRATGHDPSWFRTIAGKRAIR